jgi:hypothetical protein
VSPQCTGPAAGDLIGEYRKDLIISARSFAPFVLSDFVFQEACLETDSSSVASNIVRICPNKCYKDKIRCV